MQALARSIEKPVRFPGQGRALSSPTAGLYRWTSTKKVNILLVDDREDKLIAFQAALSCLGQNLVCARSGREALRQLLEKDFAVVVLDVFMPGMDGFETAALIRQRSRTQHTPIIFVTWG